MEVGAQLYTVRDYIQNEKDMEFTFSKISEMGYKVAQLSGVPNYDAKKVRAIADKNDIKIVLTHTAQDKVLNEIDKVIEDHLTLGAEFVGIGSLPGKYRDENFVQCFAEDYIPVAQKIKDAGLYFMYHNHAFEFEKFGSTGKYLMEILMEQMPAELMGFTLDTYWLQAGGVSVLEWIDILQDRIPCVHYKDMKIVNNQQQFSAIYEGNINFDAVINKLNEIGKTKYALVEQDNCFGKSPFDCLKSSIDNIKKHGF